MRTTPSPLRSRLLAVAAALALPLGAASAEPPPGTPPPPPPPPSPAAPAPAPAPAPGPASAVPDALQLGARYFDEAIAWVARGGTMGKARDFYAALEVVWDLPDNHHEGHQEVWFATPDRMRTVLSAGGQTTTKILKGDQAWIVQPSGGAVRVHGTPDGEAVLKQLKEDLLRLQDLTAFVTLEGLKGPGVVFEFEGTKTGTAGGVYEGRWLKINRRSPDGRKMTFWIAYDANERGDVLRATWPGVVRVDGDAAQGLHTEDWILRDWESPNAKVRTFRYPRKIQGWRLNPDKEAAKTDPAKRFVSAILEDVLVNQGIEPSKFEPPAAAPGR